MRVVIVSNSVWSNENSFGNSFTNIFEGIEDLEIANVACKMGKPDSNIVSRSFQITEKSLIKNLLKGTPSGKEIPPKTQEEQKEIKDDLEEKTAKYYKMHKNQLTMWARALIWKICRWKTPELIEFLDDFKPEMVFIPIYYSHYIHDINFFIMKRYNIPCVGYISDDNYSLRQFSLSPLYWLDRFMVRPKIARVFKKCDTVYVISEIQRREYAKLFGDKFKVLTKCGDFSDEKLPALLEHNEPIKFLYTGNLSCGRADSLAALSRAINKVNNGELKFKLDIYSNTPISEKEKNELDFHEGCSMNLPISFNEVIKLQSEADVLVHVEGFKWKDRLTVHQSFSTKIVDYLMRRKCIMAIGKDDCASISYFIDNDAGLVCQSEEEIENSLRKILENKAILDEYADKAWNSGKKNHSAQKTKADLKSDLDRVYKQSKNA